MIAAEAEFEHVAQAVPAPVPAPEGFTPPSTTRSIDLDAVAEAVVQSTQMQQQQQQAKHVLLRRHLDDSDDSDDD